MSLTHIHNDTIILNSIIRNLSIDISMLNMDNVLTFEIDEEKLFNILGQIAIAYVTEHKLYTGHDINKIDIDKIQIYIGGYKAIATPKYEVESFKRLVGFKKEQQ